MKEIKAKDGFYLSDKSKSVFFQSVKGANIQEDDYIEVTVSEAESIIKHDTTIAEIDTLEKVDDCAYKAGLIAECMNIVPMSNKEAIARTSLFPRWEDFIGKTLEKGFKFQYKESLYEVIQTVPSVVGSQTPDLIPANYGLVSEHEGTKDDPIPYVQMMLIRKDKYYTQGGKLYVGIMDAPNGYAADLDMLPTLVQEVKE